MTLIIIYDEIILPKIRLGTTPKTVSKLVNGQANLSNDLEQKLSIMLGISIEVWLNLQMVFGK